MSAPTAVGMALARAAEALVGTSFRLHGRDPATGLDCLGLVAASLDAIGRPAKLPNGYRLRARDVAALISQAGPCGAFAASGPIEAGDVALVRIGPGQFHMLIATGPSHFVHAHAGLRRVVACDGPMEWPIVSHWRLADNP